MATTYEPIQTYTLGSAQSSITFSSIPATYTDLKLVFIGTGTGTVRIQANGDTSALYSSTWISENGSAASSSSDPGSGYGVNLSNIQGISSTIPQLYTVDFFSYAGSTYKTFLATVSADRNGSGSTGNLVGLWRNTTAISSIVIDSTGNAYNTGFTATLYGIKSA